MAESKRGRAKTDGAASSAPSEERQSKAKRALDRKHWAARIGVSFSTLKSDSFKKMYPFASRLHSLKGKHYHYVDEGQGEPVVMVHGNPTWSFFYRKLIQGLSATHRCLAPDHIGCGLSEKPKKFRYTLEQHILNLESWLEETLPPPSWNGGKINMIVHDWGGPIGLGYALRHPERINRLVLLNTWAFASGQVPWRIRICRGPILGQFLVRGLNLFASLATEMTTVKAIPYRAKKAYTMPYNSWKNRIAVYNFVKDIPIDGAAPTRALLRKIEELLPKTFGNTPVLIQWGMQDWCFTPEFLKMWKNMLPRAEVDEYDEAGHYVLEDAGDEILARVRKFLQAPVL